MSTMAYALSRPCRKQKCYNGCGELVKDVTTHPALRNGVRTLVSLYDMQHDPALRDAMTYVSPTTGERVGLSFITPYDEGCGIGTEVVQHAVNVCRRF